MTLSVKKAAQKNGKILALFAIACTIIVMFVYQLTKDEIAFQKQQELLKNLNSLIPQASYNNLIHQDCYLLPRSDGNVEQLSKIYRARFDNKSIAAAITTVAPDGYNGNIELLVAINTQGVVSGVRTLKHNETPGLGDKIELRKSPWVKSFENKALANENDSRWKVAKDGGMFDQFTGATITPRAVVKAVKSTVNFFNKNQASIFAATSNCTDSSVSKNTEQESSLDSAMKQSESSGENQ